MGPCARVVVAALVLVHGCAVPLRALRCDSNATCLTSTAACTSALARLAALPPHPGCATTGLVCADCSTATVSISNATGLPCDIFSADVVLIPGLDVTDGLYGDLAAQHRGVRFLDASFNKVASLGSGGHSLALPCPGIVDLSHNVVFRVGARPFASAPGLPEDSQWIDLSDNELNSDALSSGALLDPQFTGRLDLSTNLLSGSVALQKWPRRGTLILSGNLITGAVLGSTQPNASATGSLVLANNRIDQLASVRFEAAGTQLLLAQLDLSSNHITILEADAHFIATRVGLASNSITTVQTRAFHLGGDLVALDLADNQISLFLQNWQLGLPTSGLNISLQGNPSLCKAEGDGIFLFFSCQCAPGLYGNGEFCSNASCPTIARNQYAQLELLTGHGRYLCLREPTVANGQPCPLECAAGFERVGPPTACVGGLWGSLPSTAEITERCQPVTPGPVRGSNTELHVLVGVFVSLVVVAVGALVGTKLWLRHRARKDWHIFISYRVDADADLAQRLYTALSARTIEGDPVRCFLDRESIEEGVEWKEAFTQGLTRSCLFLPVVSVEAMRPFLSISYFDEEVDHYLYEMELALRLKAADRLVVFPLFVRPEGEEFSFDTSHLPNSASSTNEATTIRQTVDALFKIQGAFVDPSSTAQHSETHDRILHCLRRKAWFSDDPQCLHLKRHYTGPKAPDHLAEAQRGFDPESLLLERPLLDPRDDVDYAV